MAQPTCHRGIHVSNFSNKIHAQVPPNLMQNKWGNSDSQSRGTWASLMWTCIAPKISIKPKKQHIYFQRMFGLKFKFVFVWVYVIFLVLFFLNQGGTKLNNLLWKSTCRWALNHRQKKLTPAKNMSMGTLPSTRNNTELTDNFFDDLVELKGEQNTNP